MLVGVIRLYQCTLSPLKVALLGPAARCRHIPSCSTYAIRALQSHGAVRGLRLALFRLARCHPWGTCGHDPVPLPPGGEPQALTRH